MNTPRPAPLSIDADAVLAHAARVLQSPAEALYALFPQDNDHNPDSQVSVVLRWYRKKLTNVELSWSPVWIKVSDRAADLWTPRILDFLSTPNAMPLEALALRLERHLTDTVRSRLLLEVRKHLKADQHDLLVAHWRHAKGGDAAKKLEERIRAIHKEWESGRVNLMMDPWTDLLNAALTRAITATTDDALAWSAHWTAVCTADPSAESAPAEGAPLAPVRSPTDPVSNLPLNAAVLRARRL